MKQSLLVPLAVAVALFSSIQVWAEWDPEDFADQGTLEFLTVGPKGKPHWSTVWLVVLDGDVYIRLGSRAAGRMRKNTTAPFVKVRIAGEEFDNIRADPAAEMQDRVAAAMADKYWSDFLVRFFSHPLTMRLAPEKKTEP